MPLGGDDTAFGRNGKGRLGIRACRFGRCFVVQRNGFAGFESGAACGRQNQDQGADGRSRYGLVRYDPIPCLCGTSSSD